jgi:hypothetical protein
VVYLEDNEIRGGRDPSLFAFQEPRLDHLLPHDIALICEEDEGSNIILDVKNSTSSAPLVLFVLPKAPY